MQGRPTGEVGMRVGRMQINTHTRTHARKRKAYSALHRCTRTNRWTIVGRSIRPHEDHRLFTGGLENHSVTRSVPLRYTSGRRDTSRARRHAEADQSSRQPASRRTQPPGTRQSNAGEVMEISQTMYRTHQLQDDAPVSRIGVAPYHKSMGSMD